MVTSQGLNKATWSTVFVALLVAGAAQAGSSYFVPPPNNSFEDGVRADGCTPVAWYQYFVDGQVGAVRGCASADRANTGYFSAKFVDGNAADWGGLFSVSRNVYPGQCLKGWAFMSSPDGARGHIFLEFFDANGNRVLDVNTGVDLGNAWQLVMTPQGCAPYNAVSARILLYSCISCVGTWYADDVLWEVFI